MLSILALPFQRRFVSWLSRKHDLLNIASGILLFAVGIFGILTELLPHYRPDFCLNQMAQLLYWLVVAIITIATAIIYQVKTYQESKPLENPA